MQVLHSRGVNEYDFLAQLYEPLHMPETVY